MGPAKPRVGLWLGLRAAEAGVGELEALETVCGQAASRPGSIPVRGALSCSLCWPGVPQGSASPSSPDLRGPSWVQEGAG